MKNTNEMRKAIQLLARVATGEDCKKEIQKFLTEDNGMAWHSNSPTAWCIFEFQGSLFVVDEQKLNRAINCISYTVYDIDDLFGDCPGYPYLNFLNMEARNRYIEKWKGERENGK